MFGAAPIQAEARLLPAGLQHFFDPDFDRLFQDRIEQVLPVGDQPLSGRRLAQCLGLAVDAGEQIVEPAGMGSGRRRTIRAWNSTATAPRIRSTSSGVIPFGAATR